MKRAERFRYSGLSAEQIAVGSDFTPKECRYADAVGVGQTEQLLLAEGQLCFLRRSKPLRLDAGHLRGVFDLEAESDPLSHELLRDRTEQLFAFVAHYMRKTPKRVGIVAPFAAAARPAASARRVSSGSITPSSHRRAVE